MQLPFPCGTHRVLQWRFCFPTEFCVCFLRIGPNFFDVAGAASDDFVGHFYAGGFFKRIDEFEHRDSASGAEIVNFDESCRFV